MHCEGMYPMKRATTGSACYDLYAQDDFMLFPDRWTKVATGYHFDGTEKPYIVFDEEISPRGSASGDVGGVPIISGSITTERKLFLRDWVFRIYPRSSYGIKYGLTFKNPPVIDMDFRDEMILVMKADHHMTINRGERYAQGKFEPYAVLEDEEMPTKTRTGGVGSTGF